MISKDIIPNDLLEKRLWILYKKEKKGNGLTKIPYQINGTHAKSNDEITWNSIDNVLNNKDKFDGIGFCFKDDICGIDIDKCYDEKGNLSQLAIDIGNIMKGAYIEKSPSGTGIHILFRANNIIDKEKYYLKNISLDIEIYGVPSNRFFTFTGNKLNKQTIKSLPNLTEKVREVQEKYMRRETKSNIIKKALTKDEKLNELWNKKATGAGGTESEDDMALCSKLAFYLKNDYNKIKEYFFKSPYFNSKDNEHKKKCLERDDYLKNTIDKVIKNTNFCKSQKEEIKPLKVVSAKELQNMDIPKLNWIVEDLILEGLTIIVSPPKFGKSWLALDLCLCVANGENFINFQTNKSSCLYLALEDSYGRLKNRMNLNLNGKEAPENFYFVTDSNKSNNGLLEQLEIELDNNPTLRLIVIDTLQKVREISNTSNMYANDYDEISTLKKFADLHHIALVIIHHTRKNSDTNDPYANINGTNGIAGSVDTMIVMSKEKRSEEKALFSITGRDVMEKEFYMYLDKNTYKWKFICTQDEYIENQKALEYENSIVVRTIKKLLEENKYVKITCEELKEKINETFDISYDKTNNVISKEIRKFTNYFNLDNINVIFPPKNGGKNGRQFEFITINDENDQGE